MSSVFSTANSNLVKLDLYNTTVTANTNIAPQNITASIQGASLFIIYITVDTAGSLSVVRNFFQAGQIVETFAAEVANQPNFHNIEVSFNEILNFRYSAGAVMKKLTVIEIVPLTFHPI